MKESTYCLTIKYCRKEPESYSLYSNEYHSQDHIEHLLFDRYINNNETMESLNGRLNVLLRRITDELGNIIRVEKNKPNYDENGLCSWIVKIYIEFIAYKGKMSRFDDIYSIGLVCRSREDESSFSFFDASGNLYLLGNNDKEIRVGDVIVFKKHRDLFKSADDNFEEYVPFGEEDEEEDKLNDFELYLDSPDSKPSLSPFIDEQERLQDESFWKRESAQVKYTLLPEFVLFSELEPFTTDGKTRGYSHSMKRMTYSSKGDSIYLYNDFWKCVFVSSFEESVLLRNTLLPPISEATFSSYTDFNNLCSQIWEHVNGLDIKKVFSTYQIIVSDSRIVNHSDERYRQYVPSIETEDQYLRGLFPLKENGFDWIYSYGDEELSKQHDFQGENKAIESALEKYDKGEHFSFLLYNEIAPLQQRLVLQRETNRFWPLKYFENLLANIPEQNLGKYINEYNQKRLYYRKESFDYIINKGQ